MSDASSPERLGELVSFAADAMVLADAGGAITWANPATEAVLGHRPADLAGVHARDLVEAADRDGWQSLFGRLFDDPSTPVRGTFRCRRQDGARRQGQEGNGLQCHGYR